MKFLFSIGSALLLSASVTAETMLPDTSKLIVETKQGLLRGTVEKGVYVWKGVRYAQPPVGALRFRKAQEPERWEGVRDAKEYGNICHQPTSRLSSEGKMSEDCLFLNVWASANKTVNKPVLFWIHGGGFALGSGSDEMYNGSEMCRNADVVLVTINYRLGPFGFMYLEHLGNDSLKFENNLGLYDQAAALQWVKDNIAAFGGNPNNITIFGESAGANSVLSHMASPVSKGKFQKAIVQSAAWYVELTINEAKQMTANYLKLLNIMPEKIQELLSVPAEKMIEAGNILFETVFKTTSSILTFGPVIGTDFLPMGAKDMIANGSAKGIPLIIGSNHDEVNLFMKTDPVLLKPDEVTVTKLMTKMGTLNQRSEIVKLYSKYPKSDAVLSLITDAIFELPANSLAEIQSAHAPVYLYRFDWSSLLIRLINLGSCHGMELPFVFKSFDSEPGRLIMKSAANRKVNKLSDKIQAAWLSFAVNGLPMVDNILWPMYKAEQRSTLLFNNKISVVEDPSKNEREGWDNILNAKY